MIITLTGGPRKEFAEFSPEAFRSFSAREIGDARLTLLRRVNAASAPPSVGGAPASDHLGAFFAQADYEHRE
jgi:hypothetical protein